MNFITIGAIRTSWGLKGWLKILSHSGEWEHFAEVEEVILRSPKTKQESVYRVEGFRMHHGSGLLKLVGVDSPEEGKALSCREIVVPQDSGAPLADSEWYLRDLVGLKVLDTSSLLLGVVVGVIESSDDLLEIKRPDDTTFFVPFRSCFIGEPDLENQSIVLTAAWLAEKL